MATHPLVEVGHATLDALVGRGDAVAALPGLLGPLKQARAAADAACGRCGKAAAARVQLRARYDAALLAIVALPPAELRTLKALLGADRIRLFAGRNHAGTTVRHTL